MLLRLILTVHYNRFACAVHDTWNRFDMRPNPNPQSDPSSPSSASAAGAPGLRKRLSIEQKQALAAEKAAAQAPASVREMLQRKTSMHHVTVSGAGFQPIKVTVAKPESGTATTISTNQSSRAQRKEKEKDIKSTAEKAVLELDFEDSALSTVAVPEPVVLTLIMALVQQALARVKEWRADVMHPAWSRAFQLMEAVIQWVLLLCAVALCCYSLADAWTHVFVCCCVCQSHLLPPHTQTAHLRYSLCGGRPALVPHQPNR